MNFQTPNTKHSDAKIRLLKLDFVIQINKGIYTVNTSRRRSIMRAMYLTMKLNELFLGSLNKACLVFYLSRALRVT